MAELSTWSVAAGILLQEGKALYYTEITDRALWKRGQSPFRKNAKRVQPPFPGSLRPSDGKGDSPLFLVHLFS
jgi:hypothetical protein